MPDPTMITVTPKDQQIPSRTWTMDECIDRMERRGDYIVPPLNPEERARALAYAGAWYYYWYTEELPGRATHKSGAHDSMMMGVIRVQQVRDEVGVLREA